MAVSYTHLDVYKRQPRGPEIQDNDFTAQVSQCLRLAVHRELEVFCRAPAHAGLALTIVGADKEPQQRGDERQNQACLEFSFQWVIQPPYNECFRDPNRIV